mmetsp:Transcript_11282/g.28259  ORF Transcript_11282/g.28259 Transcript_11282/m.28259 type:complete len:255 (+) Transcript_11282:40-804(+)
MSRRRTQHIATHHGTSITFQEIKTIENAAARGGPQRWEATASSALSSGSCVPGFSAAGLLSSLASSGIGSSTALVGASASSAPSSSLESSCSGSSTAASMRRLVRLCCAASECFWWLYLTASLPFALSIVVSDVALRLPSSVGFSILWYSRLVRQRCSAGSRLYGALYSARKVVKEQTRSGLASSDARASRAFITFLSIGFSSPLVMRCSSPTTTTCVVFARLCPANLAPILLTSGLMLSSSSSMMTVRSSVSW